MGSTDRIFYPRGTEWDGTDPGGGDIRQLSTSMGSVDNTSICNFGTSGSKTITVDPYTTRSTTGLSSDFGWAMNIAGSEGMDGTADAKRVILFGPWTFEGSLIAAPVASLASCTVDCRLYRVSADGSTRTLIFSASTPAGIVSATGTGWTLTTGNKGEIVFEPGETWQMTYTLTCTGQIGGLTIAFQTGNGNLTDCRVVLPTPGLRTQYLRDLADTGPADTDALTRIAGFDKQLSDSGPQITDDLLRTFTGARDLSDSGPADTDSLARVVSFPRALDDTGPTPTDDLARQVTFSRATDDSGPQITDSLARQFAGARALADTGPAGTDTLTRQVTYARALDDDINGGTTIVRPRKLLIVDD